MLLKASSNAAIKQCLSWFFHWFDIIYVKCKRSDAFVKTFLFLSDKLSGGVATIGFIIEWTLHERKLLWNSFICEQLKRMFSPFVYDKDK